MKLCRFQWMQEPVRVGLANPDGSITDLTAAGVVTLSGLLEQADALEDLARFARLSLPRYRLDQVRLLAPVDRQEVWAAGVTYVRSKKARMEESEFSANAYDRVYDAERPELFFKSLPEKVVGPGESVGIRHDSQWNVPEPELVLVLSCRGEIVGYSIGNDMSSRDIEGANLLYLPQAKVYSRSCAVGPYVVVGSSEAEAREWLIRLSIERGGRPLFAAETNAGQIKRSFAELTEFLGRSQFFPYGAMLLTGTGLVPEDNFTLQPGDRVQISISGIGTLENPVIEV